MNQCATNYPIAKVYVIIGNLVLYMVDCPSLLRTCHFRFWPIIQTNMSSKLLAVLSVVAVALIVTYVAVRDSSPNATHPTKISLPEPMLEHGNNSHAATVPSDRHDEEPVDESEISEERVSQFELARSVYEADRDFREEAIAAVEKEMTQRLNTYPDGWIRWQPLWVDPYDITNGDYLNENAVAREFTVSPFPDRTYRATRTEYRPRARSASASWFGVLDDGESGSIEINIQATHKGPELRIRLRTPDGHFNIMPTETYGAYVAGEPNQVFWSQQVVVQ